MQLSRLQSHSRGRCALPPAMALSLPATAAAQATGGVAGTVTRTDDNSPLGGVVVQVKGTTIRTITNPAGRYPARADPRRRHDDSNSAGSGSRPRNSR